MADNSGGSNSALALLVGALLVAVVVLGFFLYSGGHLGAPAPNTAHFDVHVQAPKPSG
jgi:hypothetical protein